MTGKREIRSPKDLARFIDHTLLSMNATTDDIRRLCKEALVEGFYAVCVNPIHVSTAASFLKGSDVKVVSVIGFPLGQTFTEVKIKEAIMCVEDGAEELDIVGNLTWILEGKFERFENELKKVIDSAKKIKEDITTKVIIEVPVLSKNQAKKAALCVANAGADFVKTATGKGPRGTVVDDVILLREVLPENVKIKAAGGIRTLDQAISLIKAGADRLGTSSAMKIIGEAKEVLEKKC